MKRTIRILWEENKRYILLFAVAVVAIIFSISVYLFMDFYTGNNPFLRGEVFYENKEYDKAKREYLIYLESSKYGLERWKAWDRLYYIMSQIEGQLEESVSLLDKMKKEYKDNNKKEYIILERYISVYAKQEKHIVIIGLLEKILSPPIVTTLSDDKKIQFCKDYSRTVVVTGEFARGIDFLKSILPQQDVSSRMQYLYELGILYMGEDEYGKAQECFNEVLSDIKKENPLGYMSIFFLGNIAVSKGELTTAKKMFEEILDIYPNKEVIRLRLEMIEKMRSKVL
ncbi:MAG: tetratricopeptide repeat protein [Desulfovibrionaceae bacterium]